MSLVLALSGCAATSGNDWLNSPIDPPVAPTQVALYPPEPAPEARPRLSHTVTLGESYADSASAPPGIVGDAPPIQVNVHTPVIVNNYGGYGYGSAYGYTNYGYGYAARASYGTSHATHGAPTKVGGDFPAPPDYGPRALR